MKNTMNKRTIILALACLLLMAMGVRLGYLAGVKAQANNEAATMSISEAITYVADEDMAEVVPLMNNQEALDRTSAMLGGEANCQAFLSAYATQDPAFEERLISWVEINKLAK